MPLLKRPIKSAALIHQRRMEQRPSNRYMRAFGTADYYVTIETLRNFRETAEKLET